MGLAVAVANGRLALVPVPTTLVHAQWPDQHRRFFRVPAGAPAGATDGVLSDASSDAPDEVPPVADAPPAPGRRGAHLTALTYQSLAVVDDSGPWQEAARRRWIDEPARDGRSPARASAWLDELAASNRSAYTRGIRSRAAAVRRVDELDDDAVAALLSSSAKERLDALIDDGVATIVVDECHHLRAHWAVVVQYLRRRLAAAGRAPTLIGLTATAPSREDPSYARYHALLGEVDAEVPVPAVIRAGCLAPARELAWFTLPTPEETGFLATAGAELRHRIAQFLLAPDGVDYLLGVVAPGMPADALGVDEPRLVRALVAGFDADPVLAAAAGAVLRRTGDYTPTPLSVLAVPLLPELGTLDAAEELQLLARYALDRLLPDRDRRGEWNAVRETLRGFGMHLTDAGIRAGRSPVDVITAGSRAKDVAVVDILRRELAALGPRLRAVVVTDAAERSAVHRALDVLAAPDRPGAAGGAGPVGGGQDVQGAVDGGALGGVGDDDGPQPRPQGGELAAQDVDDGHVLGPRSRGDDVHRGAPGADAGVGQVHPEAAQGLAHRVPLPPPIPIGQEAVEGVAGQELELLGRVEGAELGQERDGQDAQRRGRVVARAAQDGAGRRGQDRIGVEAGDEGAHQPRLVHPEGVGGHSGGDDAQEVVHAVGGEQELGDAVAQLGAGRGQEARLLRGGEREPGQLPGRCEASGADDGGHGHLGVDLAQEGVVARVGGVLAARGGGGQADEGGRPARRGQAPAQVLHDDGPVGAQVVALVDDDGGDAVVDEGVQALLGRRRQEGGDGVVVELVDAAHGGGPRADAAGVGAAVGGGELVEPGARPGGAAPVAGGLVDPAPPGRLLPGARVVDDGERLVGQGREMGAPPPRGRRGVGDGRDFVGGVG